MEQNLTAAQLNQLLDSINDYAIVQLDVHGKVVFLNEGARRIFGLGQDSLGRYLSHCCPLQDHDPDDAEADLLDRVKEYGTAENFGIRIRLDKTKIWTHAVYEPILDSGTLVGFSVVLRDLTERRLAESKYKGLVDSAPDAMLLLDHLGNINLVNEKTQELFGRSKIELLGKPVISLFKDPFIAQEELALWNVYFLRSTDVLTRQVDLCKQDQASFPAEINIKLIHTASGDFMSCAIRDISQRVKTDQDLAIANENVNLLYKWIQGIIDGNTSLIAGIDTQFKLVAFNTAYKNFLTEAGVPLMSIGQDVRKSLQHLSPEYTFLEKHWTQALAGEAFDVEENLKTESGQRIFKLSFSPVHNEKKVLIGAAHIITDITAEREREDLLNKSLIEAKESARLKQEFLTNMSHEIRTPMNAILGFTRILLQSDEIIGENKNYLHTISNSTKDLLVIINDILDFSKLDARQLKLELIHFSLKDKLRELQQLFEAKSSEQGIQIRLHVDNDVPDVIVGDPVRLGQLLTNLLGNSVKFTSKGFVELRCSVNTSNKKTANICFSVSDTGIGIDPSKIDVIFNSFEQAEGHTSRKYGGTGLGLAIVKNLADLMNGTLNVESIPGKGSVFTFIAPFEVGNRAKVSTDFDEIEIPKNSFPIKVLMAEDNRNNQVLGKKVLTGFGCTVDLALNGREAVDMVQKHDYDIVLMDIQMPEMDGLEAVKIIRNLKTHKCDIPIIALTAHAMRDELLKYLEAGMNACVTKPFNPKELYMTMLTLVKVDYTAMKQA